MRLRRATNCVLAMIVRRILFPLKERDLPTPDEIWSFVHLKTTGLKPEREEGEINYI